jgi:hypothetical protein
VLEPEERNFRAAEFGYGRAEDSNGARSDHYNAIAGP